MRVLYYNCFADPWIKVAQILKEENGYEPVYWVGYSDDESEKLIPKAFPDTIYQPYYHPWKGVFPEQIEKKYQESYLNIDLLKENASFELQAIKMMDRMDFGRYDFNFMERQRHFRNLVKYSEALLASLRPDAIIGGLVPHRVFDFVLYIVCKYYKIKFLCFLPSSFEDRLLISNNVYSIGSEIEEEYKRLEEQKLENEFFTNNIDKKFLDYIFNIRKDDYLSAQPYFVAPDNKNHKKGRNFLMLTKKFFEDIVKYKSSYFGKNGYLTSGIPTYYKEKAKPMSYMHKSILKYSIDKIKSNRYKRRLKKYYNSLTEKPNLKESYAIYFLHYQPEMTTSPAGDIFVDQRLCIEVLLKNLPADYNLYIKEHPFQFFSHLEGQTSRIKEFYDDLVSNPRVKLIPTDFNPFQLIKNAKVVSTITGTVGWEAMVFGKPVINFGQSWYEKYPGVLKVTDETSASKIKPFLRDYRFDEKKLLKYLYAFEKVSVKAYHYRGLKELVNQPEGECINNLAKSIVDFIEK